MAVRRRKSKTNKTGIRQHNTAAKYSAEDFDFRDSLDIDIKTFKLNENKPTWEDLTTVHGAGIKLLQAYVNELSRSGTAFHMHTVAKLTGSEFASGINNMLGILNRDIANWVSTLNGVFSPVVGRSGPIHVEDMELARNLHIELSNCLDGIENTLTPLLAELAVWVLIADQKIIGNNLAELEVLKPELRQALIKQRYTEAVEQYNLVANDRMDLKAILSNLNSIPAITQARGLAE